MSTQATPAATPVRFADLLTSAQIPPAQAVVGPFAPLPASVPPETLQTMAPTTPSTTTADDVGTTEGAAAVPGAGVDLADSEILSESTLASAQGTTPGDGPSFFDASAAQTETVATDPVPSLPSQEQGAPSAPAAVGTPELPQPPQEQVAPETTGAGASEATGTTDAVPFGVDALRVPFPLGTASHSDKLLTASQASVELAQLGVASDKTLQTGAHPLPHGGAVVVQKKEAYRLQRLTPECVASLRSGQWEGIAREWRQAAEALITSQEIANLQRLQAACAALRRTDVGSCAKSLQEKVPILERNCEQWAVARQRVAAQLHQEKQRRLHIEALRKQLTTQEDLLTKDGEATRASQQAEQRTANARAPVIKSMITEISQDARQIKSIRSMVQTASG